MKQKTVCKTKSIFCFILPTTPSPTSTINTKSQMLSIEIVLNELTCIKYNFYDLN